MLPDIVGMQLRISVVLVYSWNSLLIHNSKDRCTFYSDDIKALWGSFPRDILGPTTAQLVKPPCTLDKLPTCRDRRHNLISSIDGYDLNPQSCWMWSWMTFSYHGEHKTTVSSGGSLSVRAPITRKSRQSILQPRNFKTSIVSVHAKVKCKLQSK